MTDIPETPLLDMPLVANRDADLELASDVAVALSDEEIEGARVRLLCKTIERIDGGDHVAVALTAEFHPAPATRFTHATIALRLTHPDGAQVIEVAPVEVRTTDPVTFKVTSSGKISFEKVVKAEVGQSREVTFSIYPCLVRGSGAASRFASWSFEEHSEANDGIGQSQNLIMTLAGISPFQLEARVSARLLKPGLAGALQRVRDLLLGPSLEPGAACPVTLPVPPAAKRSGFFAFLR